MNDFVAELSGDEATIAPKPLTSSGKQKSYSVQYVFVYNICRQAQADSAAASRQCSPKRVQSVWFEDFLFPTTYCTKFHVKSIWF